MLIKLIFSLLEVIVVLFLSIMFCFELVLDISQLLIKHPINKVPLLLELLLCHLLRLPDLLLQLLVLLPDGLNVLLVDVHFILGFLSFVSFRLLLSIWRIWIMA